jgi:hypothetical protein
MTLTPAVAALGTDQPTATIAKIKTASHTKFLTVPAFERFPYPELQASVIP